MKKGLFRFKKIKFLKYTKYHVCSRKYSKDEYLQAIKLKKIIDKSSKKYIENHQSCSATHKHLRSYFKRDLATVQRKFSHIFGTRVTKLYCNEKGHEEMNTLSMCRECAYRITLPETYYPRFHFHFTCDNAGNYACFIGEGTCTENVSRKTILFDEDEVGFDNLNRWKNHVIDFTNSCSCQIIKNSVFTAYI